MAGGLDDELCSDSRGRLRVHGEEEAKFEGHSWGVCEIMELMVECVFEGLKEMYEVNWAEQVLIN
jgi:hypothetical protein